MSIELRCVSCAKPAWPAVIFLAEDVVAQPRCLNCARQILTSLQWIAREAEKAEAVKTAAMGALAVDGLAAPLTRMAESPVQRQTRRRPPPSAATDEDVRINPE